MLDNYRGRYGSSRQTGGVEEDFRGSLETEEELERRLLLERAADALSHRYHSAFLYSHYSNDIVNAISKTSRRLLLGRFHEEMLEQIRRQYENTIVGLSLGESRSVRLMGLHIVMDMLEKQYIL